MLKILMVKVSMIHTKIDLTNSCTQLLIKLFC